MWATIFMLGAPMALGIWLVADPLVRVVFGPKWIETIPLLQVLAIYGLLATCSTNSGPVYIVLKKANVLTWLTVAYAAIVLPALYWGTTFAGAYGAAVAVTAALGIYVIGDMLLVTRLLGTSLLRLLPSAWRTLCSSAAMAVAVLGVRSFLAATNAEFIDHVIELVASAVTGAAVYVGTHVSLWYLAGRPNGPERIVLSAVGLAVQRIRRAKT
jgi:O-antigen/teichoic acid export membrane protein